MDPRDTDLTTLLQDAVSDVEPTDRLAEIRESVRPASRRLGWYAAGSGFLAVAAAVTAIAVVTSQDSPNADDPAPLGTPTALEPTPTPGLSVVPVYFVGDTPRGERLFREFQLLGGRGAAVAAQAATGTADDPDYRTLWPAGSVAEVDVRDGVINVTIADESLHDRPASMTPAQAELAIQQMIYTVQAAEGGGRLPVQFRLGVNPVDQVFGVFTSEPLANAPQLDVLSFMSISNPTEGRAVSGSFTADGVASSFEGNVPWELTAADGAVVREGFTTAGMETRLIPWETEPIDVSDLPPGTYTFAARTEGGKPFTDTRTIVIE
jgi:hypothetical protein